MIDLPKKLTELRVPVKSGKESVSIYSGETGDKNLYLRFHVDGIGGYSKWVRFSPECIDSDVIEDALNHKKQTFISWLTTASSQSWRQRNEPDTVGDS